MSQAAPARSSTGEMGFLGLEKSWAVGSVARKVTYLVGGDWKTIGKPLVNDGKQW